MLWHLSILYSFVWLNNNSVYGYTTSCLSFHLLMTFFCFYFWLLWRVGLWIFQYKYLSAYIFSTPLKSGIAGMCVCSVTSNSLWPCGLQPTRFLCPWNFPDKKTGTGCHFLLQGNLQTQGSNPCLLCLLCWRGDFYPGAIWWESLSHMIILCLTFWENAQLFFTTVSFYIPTSYVQVFQFLHILANTCNFPCFFPNIAILMHVKNTLKIICTLYYNIVITHKEK